MDELDDGPCPLITTVPSSPRLVPSSPRGLSNISSLEGSVDLSAPMDLLIVSADERHTGSQGDAAPPQADAETSLVLESHTLMQMLSLVGSRLIEADHMGFSEASGDGTPRSHGDAEDSSSHSIMETKSLAMTRDASPGSIDTRRLEMPTKKRTGASTNDDDATPRDGHTPLAASLTSVRRPYFPRNRKPSRLHIAQSTADAVNVASSRSESSSDQGSLSEDKTGDTDLERSESHRPDATSPETGPRPQVSETPDRLAELDSKLRSVFGLAPYEQVRAQFSCWLFRTVLLQGQVYLTNDHLLFYAYLPSRDDHVIKAGCLRKRTRRTYRFTRHWAILRGRALSWYDSQLDPYFPRDHIDLRDISAIRASSTNPRHFRVSTPYRLFTFGVESQASRDDWVEVLQKAAFRAQNQGESVRISIPIEAVVDVDETTKSGAIMSAGIVSVQVAQWESDDFALDEYYFLHFAGAQRARFLSALRELLRESNRLDSVLASQSARPASAPAVKDSTGTIARGAAQLPLGQAPKLRQSDPQREVSAVSAAAESISIPFPTARDEDSHRSATGALPITAEARESHRLSHGSVESRLSITPRSSAPHSDKPRMAAAGHTASSVYPPSSPSAIPASSVLRGRTKSSRSWAMPRWGKTMPSHWMLPSSGALTNSAMDVVARRNSLIRPVVEVWSALPPTINSLKSIRDSPEPKEASLRARHQNLSSSQASMFSLIDPPSPQVDGEESERSYERRNNYPLDVFALPKDEKLIHQLEAYLYRILPLAGKLFLSERHLCFLSSLLTTTAMGRTKMVLPLDEIISCAKHKAYRFGQHGLVLTVRGHEELFLEFTSVQQRDECLALIEDQLESPLRLRGRYDKEAVDSGRAQEKSDAIILTELRDVHTSMSDSLSSLVSAASSESAINSTEMSFLSFQPKQTLHFTLLTIGSRGDVQPYLALAKGLKAEGHRVRIATHGEFGTWIQRHGIEFCEIGGDPAELMRICVENGTFTVSFLREGITKFRGWLDDLLVSCWGACQGTDVIIESPNALAGIHVAEALQVPYYRAFTMPWSRTRAYPQAFAVPSKKAGGSYNFMSYVIFDQVLWRASSGQINRWREQCLGLSPTNYDMLEQHKIPYLYSFSTSLVPKPLDWYDWIHVTGFWFLDNPENSVNKAWSPPEDLVAFIERAKETGRKIVYVGWGSITVPDAAATTRCVLEAVRRSGVCAVLSKGWSERLASKRSPTMALDDEFLITSGQVYRVDSVPHDWLFPLIDAACHHGGAGTIGASVRAGLPTIVKPWFGDQFFWGQQVESLGVGSCVKELTVHNLSEALTQATQNVRQIERARRLGEKIRAENGVGEAIKAIYADLDYATGLIKQRARSHHQEQQSEKSFSVGRKCKTATSKDNPSKTLPEPAPRSAEYASSQLDSRSADASMERPHNGLMRSRASSSAAASDGWSVVADSEGDANL